MVHLGINTERQRQIFRVRCKSSTFNSVLCYSFFLSRAFHFLCSCCDVLQILAGILQLGNVNFCSSADESHLCNLEEQSKGIGCDLV